MKTVVQSTNSLSASFGAALNEAYRSRVLLFVQTGIAEVHDSMCNGTADTKLLRGIQEVIAEALLIWPFEASLADRQMTFAEALREKTQQSILTSVEESFGRLKTGPITQDLLLQFRDVATHLSANRWTESMRNDSAHVALTVLQFVLAQPIADQMWTTTVATYDLLILGMGAKTSDPHRKFMDAAKNMITNFQASEFGAFHESSFTCLIDDSCRTKSGVAFAKAELATVRDAMQPLVPNDEFSKNVLERFQPMVEKLEANISDAEKFVLDAAHNALTQFKTSSVTLQETIGSQPTGWLGGLVAKDLTNWRTLEQTYADVLKPKSDVIKKLETLIKDFDQDCLCYTTYSCTRRRWSTRASHV